MANINLRDIALALNVSVSTVSKALSDSYEISDKTKNAIIAFAEANNYRPNRIAQNLKRGYSKTIGVIISAINNAVISEMLDGINSCCNQSGYHAIIMQSKETFELEKRCLEYLKCLSIDGLLISPASNNQNLNHLNAFKNSRCPIVLFDRLSSELDVFKVSAANFDAGYKATSHLIANGYTKIAHITMNSEFDITTERLEGYKKALEDHGINYDDRYVVFCKYENLKELDEEVTNAITYLMELSNPPNALFTATDRISTRAPGLIKRLNYSIPKDIALIGFTNTEMADMFTPPLTTVHQPAFDIGNRAASLLISLIRNKTEDTDYKTIQLPTKIHVRHSSMAKLVKPKLLINEKMYS